VHRWWLGISQQVRPNPPPSVKLVVATNQDQRYGQLAAEIFNEDDFGEAERERR
jgi:hypothetical protein